MRRFALALSITLLLTTPYLLAQLDLPRVGTTIEAGEQRYFLLFPNADEFRSARLLGTASGGYEFEIEDGSGARTRTPIEREGLESLRSYLANYERIVSVENDTVWSSRPLKWDLLGGIVAPYPWLHSGRRVLVTLGDGSGVEGQVLAVVDSALILSSSRSVYDPNDRSATLWRIPLAERSAAIKASRTTDKKLGPIIYGVLGGGATAGLSAAFGDGSVLNHLALGSFGGALVYGITGQLGMVEIEPSNTSDVAAAFGSIASFSGDYPAELRDRSRVKELTGTGPTRTSGPIPAAQLREQGRHYATLGVRRTLGNSGATNDHRYIDLAPFNTVGMRGSTAVASPSWEFGAELGPLPGGSVLGRLSLGGDYTMSEAIPPVDGSFGDAAEYKAAGAYLAATILAPNWEQPLRLQLDLLGGLSFGTTRVVGWLNDRALSKDPTVPEGTRVVYDITETGTSPMGGVRARIYLNEYVSSQLQVLYRPYPSVTTPNGVDSTSFGSRLSSHTVEIGNIAISAGINFHL